MTDLTVAKTILAQLGGNKFIVMTGAKGFVGTANALSFRIPTQRGISQVHIELTAGDDYNIQFIGKKGDQLIVKHRHDGIYCDQLQDLFTRITGLHTHL